MPQVFSKTSGFDLLKRQPGYQLSKVLFASAVDVGDRIGGVVLKSRDANSFTKMITSGGTSRVTAERLPEGEQLSIEDLCRLRRLISFEGPLIIFGFPEITELFLKKAQALGGKRGMEKIRTELWVGAGPKARGFTNGKLDPEYDYIAPAAVKAAAEHVGNPILGSFIVGS